MSTKHTPTFTYRKCPCGDSVCQQFFLNPTGSDGRLSEDHARLIVASINSYAKHCKDPVAAAESDLLGRALGEFERIKHLVCGDRNPNWTNQDRVTLTRGIIADICDALLAETKDGA